MAIPTTWSLTDPTGTLATYNFSVLYSTSAQGQDQETYTKNFEFEAVVVPTPGVAGTGGFLVYEGQDTPTQVQLEGLVLNMVQHQTFINWWKVRYQVELTDDRGYLRWVYPITYEYTRIPSYQYPWKGSFQFTFYVIGFPVFPS